ncbi:MAG: DUF993 family protein [Chitinophagaceae bacterium]
MAGGKIAAYTLQPPKSFAPPQTPFNRVAYAAAHVVADPFADNDPWLDVAVDWDRTIAFRKYLWSLGLGVAEAMDTAQRGMGLDWKTSLELIRRSLDAARDVPGAVIASGAGHRSSRSVGERHHRRCDSRLRRAVRSGRKARRQDHPDGEPRARESPPARPTTTPRSMRAFSAQ